MGYPRDRAEEAISINGYVESSLDWLMRHPVGWDTPHSLTSESTPQTLGSEPQSLSGVGGWNSLGGNSVGGNKVGNTEPEKKSWKKFMTQEEKDEQVKKLQSKIAERKK